MAAHVIAIVVVGGGRGRGGGVDGLVLFGSPNTVEKLVHVHGPEVLAALTQSMLELIEGE